MSALIPVYFPAYHVFAHIRRITKLFGLFFKFWTKSMSQTTWFIPTCISNSKRYIYEDDASAILNTKSNVVFQVSFS